MKDYTYKAAELELINHLINNVPHKIWSTYVGYFFDYTTYYIQIACESKTADSQNKFDEAIIASISIKQEKFVLPEYVELVCENKRIYEVYIVRSFLYFTTHTEYSTSERLIRLLKTKFKQLITFKVDRVANLIAKTTGGNQEISCHPNSKEALAIDNTHYNIIDKGLLLKMKDNYLPAYLTFNGYGFNIWDNKFFFEIDELKEEFRMADFIKA